MWQGENWVWWPSSDQVLGWSPSSPASPRQPGRWGGMGGGRASLARLGAGTGALRVMRTWYACVYSPLLVFLCCALHVGWITQDFIRKTLFLLKLYINKPSAFTHLFEDFFNTGNLISRHLQNTSLLNIGRMTHSSVLAIKQTFGFNWCADYAPF